MTLRSILISRIVKAIARVPPVARLQPGLPRLLRLACPWVWRPGLATALLCRGSGAAILEIMMQLTSMRLRAIDDSDLVIYRM